MTSFCIKSSNITSFYFRNGVNILTPKRKKKVAIRTLSTGPSLGPVANGVTVEKKPPQAPANQEKEKSDPIVID